MFKIKSAFVSLSGDLLAFFILSMVFFYGLYVAFSDAFSSGMTWVGLSVISGFGLMFMQQVKDQNTIKSRLIILNSRREELLSKLEKTPASSKPNLSQKIISAKIEKLNSDIQGYNELMGFVGFYKSMFFGLGFILVVMILILIAIFG